MARNGERPEHRVVVTGMGVLAPNGNNLAEYWDSLIEGRSGLGIATTFDVSDLPVKTVAELKNFDAKKFMDFKEAKRMARFSQVGVAAAKMAIEQSGLDLETEDRTRIGCELGTGIGGFKEISEEIEAFALRGERGPERISPFFVPRVIPNMASCQIAIQFGLEGPNNTDTTACAASTQALGNAYRELQRGELRHFCSIRQTPRLGKQDPALPCYDPWHADASSFQPHRRSLWWTTTQEGQLDRRRGLGKPGDLLLQDVAGDRRERDHAGLRDARPDGVLGEARRLCRRRAV